MMQIEAESLFRTGWSEVTGEDGRGNNTLNGTGEALLSATLDQALKYDNSSIIRDPTEDLVRMNTACLLKHQFSDLARYNANTMVIHNSVTDCATALKCYHEVTSKISIDTDTGEVKLSYKEGTSERIVPGGFSKYYGSGNDVEHLKKKQRQSVWASKRVDAFLNRLGSNTKGLFKQAFEDAQSALGIQLSAREVHLIWTWNESVVFPYHEDKEGEYTININISPSSSSMHVAGAKDVARYEGAGTYVIFPCKLVHKSHVSTFRTLKLVVFLVKKPDPTTQPLIITDLDEGTEQAGPSTQPDIEARVKPEAQDE